MRADKSNIKINRINNWWRRLVIKTIIDPISNKYNYMPKRGKLPEGANLIIANHVSKVDQFFFISHYSEDSIYFVASEDIFKNHALRWLAEHVVGMIVHMRGENALKTTKEMLRYLKAGANVGIFPEGSASFDGKTAPIDPSIGKVAKLGECNLVLIRIEGGYLSRPRWRPNICRGQVTLCEKVITREELAEIKAKELSRIVNEWLYTDAYAEQEKDPTPFVGEQPCRGLESCIYRCPGCGQITGLKTDATRIFCTCGFEATYDEYGYLTDPMGEKHTITEWCDSQKEYIRTELEAAAARGTSSFLFEDEFQVNKVWNTGKRQPIGQAHLEVFTDHTEYMVNGETGSFRHEEVENLFIFQRNPWNCHVKGKEYRYEMLGDFSANALKYQDLWQILN